VWSYIAIQSVRTFSDLSGGRVDSYGANTDDENTKHEILMLEQCKNSAGKNNQYQRYTYAFAYLKKLIKVPREIVTENSDFIMAHS
jgi:hypothetical protein